MIVVVFNLIACSHCASSLKNMSNGGLGSVNVFRFVFSFVSYFVCSPFGISCSIVECNWLFGVWGGFI